MDVFSVLVEQLDSNGLIRTFRMKADRGYPITVAFADEYEEPREGPFHFLDSEYERKFHSGFASCKARKLSSSRLKQTRGKFNLSISWIGIPTIQGRLSYYALSLPLYAIPTKVKCYDPRSKNELVKYVIRDDNCKRFIVYMECRSSYGTFDFTMDIEFKLSDMNLFYHAEYQDKLTSAYGHKLESYQYLLENKDNIKIQNFFSSVGSVDNKGTQTNIAGINKGTQISSRLKKFITDLLT